MKLPFFLACMFTLMGLTEAQCSDTSIASAATSCLDGLQGSSPSFWCGCLEEYIADLFDCVDVTLDKEICTNFLKPYLALVGSDCSLDCTDVVDPAIPKGSCCSNENSLKCVISAGSCTPGSDAQFGSTTNFAGANTFQVDSGRLVQFLSKSTTSFTAPVTFSGAGTVNFAKGSLARFAAAVTFLSRTIFDAGSFSVTSAALLQFTRNSFQFNGAQFRGAGRAVFTGVRNSMTFTNTIFEPRMDIVGASSSNRRTSLEGYTAVYFCGANMGAITVSGTVALVLQQECMVSNRSQYSNVISSLTVNSTTALLNIANVSTTSRPTLIQQWTSPSAIPLSVDIVNASNEFTQILLVYNSNSSECLVTFSAIVNDCTSGFVCTVYGEPYNNSCVVYLTQTWPKRNDVYFGFFAFLVLIPIAAAGAYMVAKKSKTEKGEAASATAIAPYQEPAVTYWDTSFTKSPFSSPLRPDPSITF